MSESAEFGDNVQDSDFDEAHDERDRVAIQQREEAISRGDIAGAVEAQRKYLEDRVTDPPRGMFSTADDDPTRETQAFNVLDPQFALTEAERIVEQDTGMHPSSTRWLLD